MAANVPQQEHPFVGYVENTGDALHLIQAARRGIIPRVTRRFNEPERRAMIRSGAIFVFSVEESGIKRWTEGLQWSPSRIAGNFLVYREVNERVTPRGRADAPSGSRGESALVFRPNGLCKKTITVKIEGSDHHLVSYFTIEDVRSGRLQRPTSRPDIMAVDIPPELVQSTNFRYPPYIEIGPDGLTRIRDVEGINQPIEGFPQMGESRGSPSSPLLAEMAPPSPNLTHHLPGQNLNDPRNFHNPTRRSSLPQQHPSLTSPAPLQTAHEFYRQNPHQLASAPGSPPHSPEMPSYPPYEGLPGHAANTVYPPYPSATIQTFVTPSSPPRQQGSWGHDEPALHAESMSTSMTGQHALSRPEPDVAWSTEMYSLPGQPLTSAPPLLSPVAPSHPTMRRREHMPNRSSTSTWSVDPTLGSTFHTPSPRYLAHEQVNQMSSPPNYHGHGHGQNTDGRR